MGGFIPGPASRYPMGLTMCDAYRKTDKSLIFSFHEDCGVPVAC